MFRQDKTIKVMSKINRFVRLFFNTSLLIGLILLSISAYFSWLKDKGEFPSWIAPKLTFATGVSGVILLASALFIMILNFLWINDKSKLISGSNYFHIGYMAVNETEDYWVAQILNTLFLCIPTYVLFICFLKLLS
jgi:hypothetical protein